MLAILAYHKIGEPPPGGWETWFYVQEETFAAHLRYLRESGWTVIGGEEFLRGLGRPETLPAKAAMLTFDDGYRSNLQIAVPWLQRFGYPGVVFVPTAFIGGRNSFDDGVEPEEAICDWEELRELERCGVSVQSHGAGHRAVSELTRAELERELQESKAALESGLGKPVEVFSYPYGDAGERRQAADAALERAGYRAACLYDGGLNPVPLADPYRVARIPMGADTDIRAELTLCIQEHRGSECQA